MARPKKQLDEDVEVSEMETAEVETVEETEPSKFPYQVKLDTGHVITVVAESTDAGGHLVLHTSEGITYHAPKAD